MNRRSLILSLAIAGVAALPAASQERVRLLGYYTLELEGSTKDEVGRRWTFDQHHFNIITMFQLDDRWRAFGEVEWEHGPEVSSSGVTGDIELERGWLEYRYSDRLQVRAGKFLSPFGIYNLRNTATPTFVMSFLPGPVYGKHPNTTGGKQRLYPKYPTGVQVLGRLSRSDWSAQYYLYVTNGRGADPGSMDDNRNKGVGARVSVASPDQRLTIGASAYHDRNGLAFHTRQSALAADLQIEHAGFLIESELLVPRLELVDSNDTPAGDFRRGRGVYVQASRSPRSQLRPFVRYEAYDEDLEADSDRESAVVVGLNFAASSRVFLKGETHFRDFDDTAIGGYRLYVFSLSAAF
jgi:hypothetical protein